MILVNHRLDAQFLFMYVYFTSLHVSNNLVLIIRRINCINSNLVCVTLCRWPSSVQVGKFLPGLHTRRSQLQKQELISFDSTTLLSLCDSNIFNYCESHKLSSALKHKSSITPTAHAFKIPACLFYLSIHKRIQNDIYLTMSYHILLGHHSGNFKTSNYKILHKYFIVKNINDL
jgi:hypothetical protein